MKIWQETSQILGRTAELLAAGRGAAVAVVTRIEGSAYRRPGAKLLIEDDGTTMGSISGGCLEGDVREVGLQVIREGSPRSLRYDTGGDEDTVWGLGLGCNGSVDIFVQPAGSEHFRATLQEVRRLLGGDEPFAVSTVIAGPQAAGRSLVVGRDGVLAGSTGDGELDRQVAAAARDQLDRRVSRLHQVGAAQVFTEVQLPPPYLLVCGAGDDAIPMVRLAAEAGFRVVVVDHRPAYLAAERFPAASERACRRPEEGVEGLPLGPRTYAVVKTHNLARDREWVRRLLAAGIPYIGLLGPRDRRDQILNEIGAADGRRVYGPVGLDIGAEGPEQVALSVIAEILAVCSGRRPIHLRERREPIHAAR